MITKTEWRERKDGGFDGIISKDGESGTFFQILIDPDPPPRTRRRVILRWCEGSGIEERRTTLSAAYEFAGWLTGRASQPHCQIELYPLNPKGDSNV